MALSKHGDLCYAKCGFANCRLRLLYSMPEHLYATQLYTQYQPLWYRVAFQIVRNADDANDVVQEAYRKFIAIEREWPSFEDAKRYFSAILTNTAIDVFKLARRRQERFTDLNPETEPDTSKASNWRRPWEALEMEREERLVCECIERIRKLPPAQRQAIERLLLDEEAKSLTELSRELGVPISTLKSRAILGIEKVKKSLRKKRLL